MTTRSEDNVRVRFAPSPTGPLHIGGVRTALYNYLFARKMNGTFILRIEDTDQNRYVKGAEEYIKSSLEWLGLIPDEGPGYGGDYGPYRQSERKDMYKKYALELVSKGYAYYAFDTPDELNVMRQEQERLGHHSAKYDHRIRMQMKNSLTLETKVVDQKIQNGDPYIIRLKMPRDEQISFEDKVREKVVFDTNELDDKVILKQDGMPTYHLANIVDDHLMQISHVIRGEEWLSSTAHHVFMYRCMGWDTPVFTHLPLLLKPSGKGKLSKRDGAKFGFPVFPLEWHGSEETYSGFREDGYDADALTNFLVLLGWNPGNDQELMSKEEMANLFSLDKIVKSGARFDVEKAKWFNQQYLIKKPAADMTETVMDAMPLEIKNNFTKDYIESVIGLMQERVHLYPEFYTEGKFFFEAPGEYDEKQVRKRLNDDVLNHLEDIKSLLRDSKFAPLDLDMAVKGYLKENELKMGVYLPLIRIILCGKMTGPDLFEMMTVLGPEEVVSRWDKALDEFRRFTESE